MNKSMFYKILGPILFLSTLFLNPPDEMTESGSNLAVSKATTTFDEKGFE